MFIYGFINVYLGHRGLVANQLDKATEALLCIVLSCNSVRWRKICFYDT